MEVLEADNKFNENVISSHVAFNINKMNMED